MRGLVVALALQCAAAFVGRSGPAQTTRVSAPSPLQMGLASSVHSSSFSCLMHVVYGYLGEKGKKSRGPPSAFKSSRTRVFP